MDDGYDDHVRELRYWDRLNPTEFSECDRDMKWHFWCGMAAGVGAVAVLFFFWWVVARG